MLRFSWAARMNPASSKNLCQAAKPTFRLDDTPQVSIPSQVLSIGPDNKKKYVIGQLHRCSLPRESTLPPLAATLGLQISTSQKDSYTIFSHSSPDAASISASTLAGSSPAQTSLQIMEGVSSDIIFNEGIRTHGLIL
ncbi:hypothetical protein F2Q69_00060280 [Brassica cretica]|uniref:Uncharacterized protein n=1 Tax=Brassica cretica TaxID=69181 RepID=A0A8S9RK69_BRACR|nr:hypothetical protein F2Q69_00060280 [Brassica cretica]